ncbi:MAG: ABC transporter permease, partial [Nitrososphaerales archaeon]
MKFEFPFEPRKSLALIHRDMTRWASYKTQAFTSIIGGLIGIASWGFIGTFNQAPVTQTAGIFGPAYQTSYVSFLVSGILVAQLVMPLNQGVQSRVNPWTLETILMSGIKTPTFVLGGVGWTYLLSVILFIPQLFIGIYVFHAAFNVNIISLIVAIAISSVVIFCLSMISAGLRIVTKTNDPVTWAINISAQLFAGMTFPISHLNSVSSHLSYISYFIPQTWIYDIMRISALDNGSLTDPTVIVPFLIAIAMACVLFPISVR